MNILVIGEQVSFQECKQKFGDQHHYSFAAGHDDAKKILEGNDLVIDFKIDEAPHQFKIYVDHPCRVLLNTSKVSLGALAHQTDKIKSKIFGFNGLPTFLNRPVLEVSFWRQNDEPGLRELCAQLDVNYSIVDDRVGLVTSRIICMIINEAYYTVQEGTATREDIDMAMKLGTNYPYGPFEWCQRIGVKHVYELLEAVYNDTKDERYKICSLLKKDYLGVR